MKESREYLLILPQDRQLLVNPQAEPHPLLINKSLKFGLDSFSLGLLQRGISDNPTAFSPLGLSEIGGASCANKKKKKKRKKREEFRIQLLNLCQISASRALWQITFHPEEDGPAGVVNGKLMHFSLI